MSAAEDASRSLEQSVHGEDAQHATLPPIAAAFLISFDLKIGYVLQSQMRREARLNTVAGTPSPGNEV